MIKRIVPLLSWLFLLLLLAGCWDVEEVDKRANILGIGIDPAPGNQVMVSIDLPTFETAKRGSTEGQSTPESGVLTLQGETVFDALSELQTKTIKPLFIGQLKVLIIQQNIAKKSIKPVLDVINRHPQAPMHTVIFLTPTSAREILSSKIALGLDPVLALRTTALSAAKANQIYQMREWDLFRMAKYGPEDPFIPMVEFEPTDKTFLMRGLGLFHRDRLVGELNGQETKMFGLMSGRARNVYYKVNLDKFGWFSYRYLRSKSTIKISGNEQDLRFKIQVRVKSYLTELTSTKVLFSKKDLTGIQQKTGQALERDMEGLIKLLQNVNSDILGLGELIRATRPDIWKKLNWEKEFPRVTIQAKVKFTIERAGEYR